MKLADIHAQWQTTTTGEDPGMLTAFVITQDTPLIRSENPFQFEGTAGAQYIQRWRRRSNGIRLLLIAARTGATPVGSLPAGADTSGGCLRATEEYEEDTWRIRNARRGVLLLKRLAERLSSAEEGELHVLQRSAEARVNAAAGRVMSALTDLPTPPADMMRIIEPPSEDE